MRTLIIIAIIFALALLVVSVHNIFCASNDGWWQYTGNIDSLDPASLLLRKAR